MPAPRLSIAAYDAVEAAARQTASYPVLRAFAPAAFAQVSFPTRVSEESELRRYADIMYEFLPQRPYLDAAIYSEQEAALIGGVADDVKAVTADCFGRPVQPLMGLFPPFPLIRVVEALAAGGGRLNILEIGPGSGHFGVYALRCGHRYLAMDNCQSLYLWQNRLFGAVANGLDELVGADRPRFDGGAQAVHIPWWVFSRFHAGDAPDVDVVVCDAAMGEMDYFGMMYVLNAARIMLTRSRVGAFLFQNLGEERINSRARVETALRSLGFAAHQIGPVSLFVLPPGEAAAAEMERQSPDAAPAFGEGERRVAPAQFLTIDRENLLESYAFMSFIGLGESAMGA